MSRRFALRAIKPNNPIKVTVHESHVVPATSQKLPIKDLNFIDT